MKESAVKNRILDVATRLFYEQGYNSTGINQIIAEADIARASLYHHFPSKKELLCAYIEHAESLWFKRLDEFAARYEDPKSRLLGIFDFRADEQGKNGFRGCHFSKVMAEVPKDDLVVFEQVAKQKDRMKAYIRELLIQMGYGKSAGLDMDMTCEAIFLLFEGCTVVSSLYKGEIPVANAKAIAASLL